MKKLINSLRKNFFASKSSYGNIESTLKKPQKFSRQKSENCSSKSEIDEETIFFPYKSLFPQNGPMDT